MIFTEKKFKSLGRSLQHKKCAELLLKSWTGIWEQKCYQELSTWMELPPPSDLSKKKRADLYHWHLKEAGVRLKEHNLLPEIKKNDKETAAPPLPLVIYLDNIRSAHNIGSIIRTIEAFSLGELIISEGMADPNHKQVRDTAMGADKWIKWKRGSLSELPRPLVAVETGSEAIPISEFPFPNSFTLAFGNEEYGLSDSVLSAADHIIQIPLVGRKNSLNVANCFAICAAEIRRQHTEREAGEKDTF